MENESKSNDEQIADIKRSIADLLAKIAKREGEIAKVNATIHEKVDKKKESHGIDSEQAEKDAAVKKAL